jgi:hypothetical protein
MRFQKGPGMKSVPRASVSGPGGSGGSSPPPEKIKTQFNAAASRHDQNAQKMQTVNTDRLAPPIKEKFQAAARGEREKAAQAKAGDGVPPPRKVITRKEINRLEAERKAKPPAPALTPRGPLKTEVHRDVNAKRDAEIKAMKDKLQEKSRTLQRDFKRAR